MLTANNWQQVCRCYGVPSMVHQFLYQANHKPPDLPITVLVDFDTYTGPPFLSSRPNCVPVPPAPLCNNYTQEPRANAGESSYWHWHRRVCSRMHSCCNVTPQKPQPRPYSAYVIPKVEGYVNRQVSCRKITGRNSTEHLATITMHPNFP